MVRPVGGVARVALVVGGCASGSVWSDSVVHTISPEGARGMVRCYAVRVRHPKAVLGLLEA